MQILVTNLVATGQLSLELTFESGPGPHGRVVRSTLAPGGSVDISDKCTLSEANMNVGLQDLISRGIVSVSVVEESTDILSSESQFNKLRNDVCQAFVAAVEALATDATVPYHKCNPESITIEGNADAAALPAVIVLANSLKTKINAHLLSTGDTGAHLAASAAVIDAADASDQATANTLLTQIKARFNTHLTEAGVHMVADATNTSTQANATDLASSVALANELKGDFNAHIAAANALDSLPMGNN